MPRARHVTIFLCVAFACGRHPTIRAHPDERTTQYTGGQWFDGQSFVMRDMYVVGGVLSSRRPSRVDSVVDLSGKFVVPPYGEAHNHNVESSRIDAVNAMYIQRGVFYVKNPNSLPRFTAPLAGRINTPRSIDAIFANGGLTGTGGHPTAIAQRQITRGAWTPAEGDGGFYFNVDTRADLDRVWPRVLAGKPDFLKTYLLYSEEYALRRADPAYADWRGLDPALLPEIVRRAHGTGLRVSTHVETAADFRAAVDAGVDEVNHLPGSRPDRGSMTSYADLAKYEISDDVASRAGRRGMIVVTTLGGTIETMRRSGADRELVSRLQGLFVRNLQRLHRAGARIAIGSDDYTRTTDFEIAQLRTLAAFDDRTWLKLWCETTPISIFPARAIGRLADGYEASFLVLAGDPLNDFANTQRIVLRVKQGTVSP